MSVLLETTLGNLVIDLDLESRQIESYNFLKLCKSSFYQFQCFYHLRRNSAVEFGDALFGNEYRKELRLHNTSVEGILDSGNVGPKLLRSSKNSGTDTETIEFGDVCALAKVKEDSKPLIGSIIKIALCENITSQDGIVKFGHIIKTCHETLKAVNNSSVDDSGRPDVDIRIKKAHILHDPFPDPSGLMNYEIALPLLDIRLPVDLQAESLDYAGPKIERDIRQKELTLEIMGDIPYIGIKPSERVLFVCKLNPVTTARDLAMIFHRFGEIISTEIVHDKDTGTSLGYGFIEFSSKESCEAAYSKMEGVLIDDRRIHVDFSQSIKKITTNTV